LEIFSRYPRVEKADGTPVTLREYLEKIWEAVAREALSVIFKDADASGLEPDARLTAMWLWTLRTTGDNSEVGEDGEVSKQDVLELIDEADEEAASDEDNSKGKPARGGGFALEFDAARKIAQGLGARLDSLQGIVEVKGQTARLLPVAERLPLLFTRSGTSSPALTPEPPDSTPKPGRGRKSKRPAPGQQAFAVGDDDRLTAQPPITSGDRADIDPSANDPLPYKPEATVLDRIHQAMIYFGAGRADALKNFLVTDGHGRDSRLWKLAQALSALYPPGTNEKRWVDGVLARKKGLGF
jgi:hypothetical protein